MINKIRRTNIFDEWLTNLKDIEGQKAIVRRIENAKKGNFGDCEPVGNGISEMRIHYGAGYRLYYFQHGKHVYFLLTGGIKKEQKHDIKLAKAIRRKIVEGDL